MTFSDLQTQSLGAVKKLQVYLRRNNLHAFFVADPSNVRYLTTFSGTAGYCLIFPDASYFITDFRYKIQARTEVASCEMKIFAGRLFEYLGTTFFSKSARKRRTIGIEDSLTVDASAQLSKHISNCEFVKTSQVIERIASVKTKPEIERIKKACWISGGALDVLTRELWTGMRERDLSATLEFNQKVLGASKESFDTIVASGARGALPHGVASEKEIHDNEFVTIDFGCFYDGYASDITRTFQTGHKVKSKLAETYDVVYDAQRRAIDAVRAGVDARKVDDAARSFIQKKGFGKYFGHGLGHGIGLRIHELPRVSRISEDVLEEGNVITIEPGIYLPNLGGVRIEDDFLVTKDGVEQISHFSRDKEYYMSEHEDFHREETDVSNIETRRQRKRE